MSSIPLRWGGMHFDCGGLYFDNLNVKIDGQLTAFVVADFDVLGLNGALPYGTQVIFRFTDDSIPSLGNPYNSLDINTTLYDGTSWRPVTVYIGDLFNKPLVYYITLDYNNLSLTVLDLDLNEINAASRDDINVVNTAGNTLYVGEFPVYGEKKYVLRGTVYCLYVFNKIKDINEFKNWYCRECYSDAAFACLFDRLLYGDTPVDVISGTTAKIIDPNRPPRWKLRLVKDMEG